MFVGGGIRTKVGSCSHNETFKYEWQPYLLIWEATKNILEGEALKSKTTVSKSGGKQREEGKMILLTKLFISTSP
jgi:hypothetical protein